MNSVVGHESPGWSAPSGQRCEYLARLGQLSLADIIELTGQAPDSDGMIGILDADETGLRFKLSERTLRLRPAMEQLDARRLVERCRLPLPCASAALVSFAREWGEIDLPARFVRAVELQQAEQAGIRWRDDRIADLHGQGLAAAQIDYLTFLKLTTFSRERHLDGGEYAERIEDGRVIALMAGPYWVHVAAVGNLEHEIAAEFMAAAGLEFPVSAEELVRWICSQGLGTVEFVPGYLMLLKSLSTMTASTSRGVAGNGRAKGSRDDWLSLEIKAALESFGGYGGDLKVMEFLKARAGQPNSPITEICPEGVIWRRSEITTSREKLTLNNLKKRLKRMAKLPANSR